MNEPADDRAWTLWEREYVRLYPDGMTLHQVARALGVSHERVWQIERRALAKVKAALAAMETES